MAEMAIIERYIAGEPVDDLAAEFGVKPTAVYALVNKRGLGHARLRERRVKCVDEARAYQKALLKHGLNTITRLRARPVSWARHAVMAALRRDGHSLLAIGAALRLDHTTVIHGIAAAAQCELRGSLARALRKRSSDHVASAVKALIASCSRSGPTGKASRK